jgi:hypothetical protein
MYIQIIQFCFKKEYRFLVAKWLVQKNFEEIFH